MTQKSKFGWLELILGILLILLGIYTFTNPSSAILNPWISVLSFSYIIGIYMILLGVGSIVMAFSNSGIRD